MPSDKLLSLLRPFEREEWTRFERFLYSPYFNDNEELRRLFHLLNDYFRLGVGSLEKKEVWKSVFGPKPYNDVRLRRLNSDLTQLAYQFLAQEYYRQQPLMQQQHILRCINRRDLHKHFMGVLRRARQLAEEMPEGSSMGFLHTHDIEYQCHIHLEHLKADRQDLQNLMQADVALDVYYILNKLRHYCDAANYALFLSIGDSIAWPAHLEGLIVANNTVPAVAIYYEMTLLLRQPEAEAHYERFIALLEANSACFARDELQNLYIYAQNYCIARINQGQAKYYTEIFKLYKTMIEKEIIFVGGLLPQQHYKNIITVGLRERAYDWTQHFIEQYTERLAEEHRDNARIYNLAKLFFQKQDYQRVIELLREVEYHNVFYALGGKLILLKSYYELSEFNALDALIESFRIYLRRNQLISKELQQQYLNLLRFVKKLSNLAPYDREGLAKLQEQIGTCKLLNAQARHWLLQKAAELNA